MNIFTNSRAGAGARFRRDRSSRRPQNLRDRQTLGHPFAPIARTASEPTRRIDAGRQSTTADQPGENDDDETIRTRPWPCSGLFSVLALRRAARRSAGTGVRRTTTTAALGYWTAAGYVDCNPAYAAQRPQYAPQTRVLRPAACVPVHCPRTRFTLAPGTAGRRSAAPAASARLGHDSVDPTSGPTPGPGETWLPGRAGGDAVADAAGEVSDLADVFVDVGRLAVAEPAVGLDELVEPVVHVERARARAGTSRRRRR